ncbi:MULTISPECIES: DNA repair protein RecN [Hydrogenophaga]|uniref:DNA repair protein RecN n=1 Tax=Hydrogenophaga intermedia TaxID=65786 RepID=A0A1L1PCQ9_HYDIT|nr:MULTISPECIES: DNA repair protein RecN [Hydrogenophaga]AOS80274.1 DNA repair protein RecN [Hydrogenophaga sp. PBC]TMU77930.1 DNA repair protein RecN [Hydrogenophaga intermedia]CDN85783.1 Recombination protein N [Hydrogenophaga intermedia]
MSLRRIVLRDFVIVTSLDLELASGFGVLTGETGAGKSILIDALQLALGARGDAGVVREGAPRCEIAAEFDRPEVLRPWLDEQGFTDDEVLLLRRTIDTDGRSRAWINGSAATLTQLRAAADALVDIHGQHAWQSLTRPEAVRELLDAYAGVDASGLNAAWSAWRQAAITLREARERQDAARQDSERLAWQIGEVDKLGPQAGEWDELNTRHGRLANAQALLDAAESAVQVLDEQDDSAASLLSRAIAALQAQAHIEPAFAQTIDSLESALAQVQDAVHELHQHQRHVELDPSALAALDERLALWLSLSRRYRTTPEELPTLHAQWTRDLQQINDTLDLASLERREAAARAAFDQAARAVSRQRQKAAPRLGDAVTEAMQTLGMQGGRFEVALPPLAEPQSHGLEQVEFRVAGHAGSTPKPVAKVASGGELSRIALAISVVTSRLGQAPTLIFDEVDAGIGGAVAHTVGQMLRQLGQDRQVLAVTHLAQVAACADHHLLVAKRRQGQQTLSTVQAIDTEPRVRELARMLGGNERSEISLAHARELLSA